MLVLRCIRCDAKILGYPCDVGKKKYCSHRCCALNTLVVHGMSHSRLYSIWSGIKSRCYSKNNVAYRYYGGRGIGVCDVWKDSFVKFMNWANSSGYCEDLELDRINVNGNCEPSNCRWVNRTNQMQNTRKRGENPTSRFKGVSWCANVNKWRVQIVKDKKWMHIGLFTNEVKAALAYDKAARRLFGEFAHCNFN